MLRSRLSRHPSCNRRPLPSGNTRWQRDPPLHRPIPFVSTQPPPHSRCHTAHPPLAQCRRGNVAARQAAHQCMRKTRPAWTSSRPRDGHAVLHKGDVTAGTALYTETSGLLSLFSINLQQGTNTLSHQPQHRVPSSLYPMLPRTAQNVSPHVHNRTDPLEANHTQRYAGRRMSRRPTGPGTPHSAWQQAQRDGVDMVQLESTLRLSPAQRIRRHARALASAIALREAVRKRNARS